MVGLDAIGMHECQRVHERPQVTGAAGRRDALLHAPPVGEESHSVARGEHHLRQGQRRGDGLVEHGLPANAGAQKPAGIDEQPHGLTAFGLVDLGDELAPARRRAPADITALVTGTIVAQIVELPPGADASGAPLFDRNLAAANQIQRFVAALLEVRKDSRGLLEWRDPRSLDETPPAAPLQNDPAHEGIASLARCHGILDPSDATGRNGHRQFGRVRPERSAHVVREAEIDGDVAAVAHGDEHRGRSAKRQRPTPPARDLQSRRRR